MTAQPVHSAPPMGTPREIRAALAGLATLNIPTELDTFEEEFADTPANEVEELFERYRGYVRRNTSPEAVRALTMSTAESEAIIRRKMIEVSR
ncbi:hypothetical protein [Kitasatospora kifunensis]|uniref:Uncharacterized protein n=1 Tax=Kitasatospora kifunensis TaxID=58351 RepID=A0A7W7RBU0_KITKI|nr:hypothetical protein [Kitasatospora kifunensis]MBB4929088.1 hypothetical protein [Kitasatospora kifunensis]